MTRPILYTSLIVTAALLIGTPRAAHAAQSYDNCTGFITSLPTVITTQGTWCLKSDLVTGITGGNAIIVNTNNVTIDCNDFKVGDLAAGAGTSAHGIDATDRLNVTVRRCNIRGFLFGIYFSGASGGGHVIEDNRFDGNTYSGLYVRGDGSVVRRNRVVNTGGSTVQSDTTALWTSGSVDVLNNTVSDAVAGSGNTNAFGIYMSNDLNGRIIGNGVRGVVRSGTGIAYGIFNTSSDRITLRDNDVVGDSSTGSTGLLCFTANGHAKDNVINGFATGINSCTDDGGNVIAP
jgi:parallel beta-helix repeat protein